ncbi:MAG TPA: pitrilysin family protein [Sedimentisphaerales bacterium]|jgi:predicted Zn-dependent peptidase|nr:pitrilysin family protein [Sedimentisphaerales bacterium]HNU30665.1 pitrilysin family protein [Sedimentisphaerales bacterium]
MQFKQKILSNGLVLIGEINPSAKSAAVGYFVRTGARDETPQINGVSHFLEHMLFKGTDRLSALDVNEAFDRRGAQFNAFTSEEQTVFYAAVLPEYLIEITGLWGELMRPALRDDDFAIEKNVIKEEIAMYQDTPTFDVMDRCRSLHFGDHPCGYSVLGTVESVEALTAGQMREYFARRYVPNNMVVACTGNFDWDRFCETVEAASRRWTTQPAERPLAHCDGTRQSTRAEKANLKREHICLMHAGVSAQDPRRFAASLLSMIVGDDYGSRFYWDLVDKALTEEASMHFSPMDGTGVFCSYFRCGTPNVGKILGIVEGIFSDLVSHGVREEELVKARNKVLSALVLKNELPMGRLVDLGFNWMYLGEYRPIEQDVEAIKAVRVEDVNRLIGEIDLCSHTQYVLGPVAAA